MRKSAQRIDQTLERRQQDARARVPEHQRVREIVDVFRSAREMDELERALHLPVARQALLLLGLSLRLCGAPCDQYLLT